MVTRAIIPEPLEIVNFESSQIVRSGNSNAMKTTAAAAAVSPTVRWNAPCGTNCAPHLPSVQLTLHPSVPKAPARPSTPLAAASRRSAFCLSKWRKTSADTMLRRTSFCDSDGEGSAAATRASSSSSNDSSTGSSSPSPSLGCPWEDVLDSYAVRVVSADAMAYDVPLLAPFAIASTTVESVRNVAVRVVLQDGSAGWGESPTLSTVTAEDQQLALAKASEACSFLTSQPVMRLRDILVRVSSFLPGHDFASVRAGMEMALMDAVAVSLEIPLWRLFGESSSSIVTDITIPICTPEEAEKLAAQYARRGFATIKTKIGGRALSSDVSLLQAIRRGHPSCDLILDANCGYRTDDALQLLRILEDLSLSPRLFEQPVARDDWDGLRRVSQAARARHSVPVAADESCRSLQDATRIMEGGLAEVINLKLAKLGVMESLELVKVARNKGFALMIGGMVETRLAMGFAAHLAAGLGCFSFVDLDTPFLLAEDPVRGGYSVNGAVFSFPSESYGHGGTLKLPASQDQA